MLGKRRAKRTPSDNDESYPSLDDQLETETKKLRISGSPGELSLLKEIDDFKANGSEKVVLQRGARAMFAMIIFTGPPVEQFCPKLFSIEVGKHYPHDPPSVRVVEAEYFGTKPIIDMEGMISHTTLSSDTWNALLCMKDVVSLLGEVRASFRQGHAPRPLTVLDLGTGADTGIDTGVNADNVERKRDFCAMEEESEDQEMTHSQASVEDDMEM
jgi:ubiquitin-protein ligase